jgi:DNA-binding transcriptional LysR family regulator
MDQSLIPMNAVSKVSKVSTESIVSMGSVESLRPLRCFVAVAETLHFGQAALRLVLPQSTVSEQIRKLESVVGGELFIRTSRNVSLSPLGSVLLPEARRALEAVHHAYSVTARTAETGQVPMLFGVAVDVDAGEFARAFPLLRTKLPGVKVSPIQMPTGRQIESILDRRLHLGFVWEPPTVEHLEQQIVGYTGLIAMVPFDHALADRVELSMEELCTWPLVLFSPVQNPWVRQRFDMVCREENVSPLISAEGVGYEGQVSLVLAGAGIGVTAASIGSLRSVPGIVHVPVPITTGWRRCLIWHTDETHPGVAALREIMSELRR